MAGSSPYGAYQGFSPLRGDFLKPPALRVVFDWSLDIDLLPDLITDKTQAIVLVSPSNPTGKIFSEDELILVGEIAKRHNILIIIDDPYSAFVYDNKDKNILISPVLRNLKSILFICIHFQNLMP